MNRPLRAVAAVALLVLVTLSRGQAQTVGSIEGIVIDQQGAPVQGADVAADPINGKVRIGFVRPHAESDASGHFSIEGLAWRGTYKIFAKKLRSDYPNMAFSFYSDDIYPTALIGPSNPVAHITVRLGPPAAALTGSITDAQTGRPMPAAMELKRIQPPNKWISVSVPPEYRVLIPPSVTVSVTVTAPGYLRWTPPEPLTLASGTEMRLDVALEPAYNPNVAPSKFLIPDGYVGWVLLAYDQKNAPAAPSSNGERIFKFPGTGRLKTSSRGPESDAKKEYLYYSREGSIRDVPMDYRDGDGMIWGEYQGTLGGVISEYGFFVGTHDQYEKAKNRRPFQ
ncbi:MAG: DUF6843 domain-containing protein [Candidatus Acidiferrales bacterium]